MRVRQIMSSPIITIDKCDSLAEAIKLMQRNEVSRLLVLENKKIVGVITEKDMARELGSTHTYRISPGSLHVSNIMTQNPVTVEPEVTAKRAAELMLERDVSGLPVVDGNSALGIVTKLDFAKVCSDYDDVYVGQVMRSSPLTVSSNDRVIHARKIMLEEDLLVLPVVEEKELVGVLTIRDVAMKLAAFQEVVPDKYKSERIRNLLVGDVMTQSPATVKTDTKLSEAAKLMFDKRYSGLPVLNLEGELVGLLTKTELTEVARERL